MATAQNTSQSIAFPTPIRTHAQGVRPQLRTVHEAIGFIDDELPQELRSLSRWTFARALLVEAGETGKKRDLISAIRQLEQALDNEGWLAPAVD
jgi:hypothetical protein